MSELDDKTVMRARDFWCSLVLLAVSVFFLWKTSAIPLFGENRAGVSGADWYNSAAIVPLGLFTTLFVLSLVLMGISIRDGGARHALSATGLAWTPGELRRVGLIAVIMTGYIAGLVPRVDFILSSGLLITALIYGFHRAVPRRMLVAAGFVLIPGLYAFLTNTAQSDWNAHDDDWVTLITWIALTALVLRNAGSKRINRIIPLIALVAPLILVCVMAFGFRQNVPARGGLIFAQIEYHYYVTLRPIWRQ